MKDWLVKCQVGLIYQESWIKASNAYAAQLGFWESHQDIAHAAETENYIMMEVFDDAKHVSSRR